MGRPDTCSLTAPKGWVTTIAGYFVPCSKSAGLNRLPTTVLPLFVKVTRSMSMSLFAVVIALVAQGGCHHACAEDAGAARVK